MRDARARYKDQLQDILAEHPEATIIPLRSKRIHDTRFVLGLFSELPAVFTVVTAGLSALQGGHDTAGRVLAAAELITGAGVLIAVGLEARHMFGRGAAHASAAAHQPLRIDGSSLAAAAMGYVEAWHRTHVSGHFKLVSPQMVGATASLLMAVAPLRRGSGRRLSIRKQNRRPRLAITPESISYFPGFRGMWKAKWSEVAAVEHAHGEIAVRLQDGRRHVLHAADHLEGEAVLAQARAAVATHAPHVAGAVSRESGASTTHRG